jgi:hypothetical protein
MLRMRGWGVLLAGLTGAGVLAGAMVSGQGVPARLQAAANTAALSRPGSMPHFGNPAGHFPVPAAGRAVNTSHPNHVVGHGTRASCT